MANITYHTFTDKGFRNCPGLIFVDEIVRNIKHDLRQRDIISPNLEERIRIVKLRYDEITKKKKKRRTTEILVPWTIIHVH